MKLQRAYPVSAFENASRNSLTTIALAVAVLCALVRVDAQETPNATPPTNFYFVPQGGVLSVPAPGVLNGSAPGSQAAVVTGPNDGSLVLSNNGGFLYTPAGGFSGVDSFTWQASDGSTSSVAQATIDVTPPGDLFYDNFQRPPNADPIAPWTPVLGDWMIADGELQGTNPADGTFSDCAIFGNWTNYTVKATIQIPADGFAGGLDGRIDPASGSKYTVNIYPYGFPNQTTSPIVQLLKFNGWNDLSLDPLAVATLPSPVDTNPHMLSVTFQGNQITVFFDGTQIIQTNDNNYGGLPPYESGGIAAHFYNYLNPYLIFFQNVEVTAGTVSENNNYTATENHLLTVGPPGVLGNEKNATAVLTSSPANGTLNLNPNGGFTYMPATNFIGVDSFTYQAEDGASTSAVATVTITVVSSTPVGTNSYVPTPGVFSGLFYAPNGIAPSSAGYFTFTVTKRSTYSGYLQLRAERFVFHGKFDADGQATNTLARGGGPPLMLNLNMGTGSLSNQVSGSVSSFNWTASLSGNRATFDPRTNPTTIAGNYTLVFPGQQSSNSPAGNGFGTVRVGPGGYIVFSGRLADGAVVSQTASLSPDGTWPLFVSLYGGLGVMEGWLNFTNQTDSDLSGQLTWVRPAISGVFRYPGGFTNQFTAVGSAYTAPVGPEGRSLNFTNAAVAFSGGVITTPFTNSITLGPSGQVTDLSMNPLTLKFSQVNGLFSGQVGNPHSGVFLPFSGVVFQKLGTGYGMHLGTDSSSSQVVITPQ